MPQKRSIKESMDRFLSQYLPMLWQQQQRKGYIDYSQEAYLERYLKQLEAQGEYTATAEDRRRLSNLIGEIFRSVQTGTKDLPYPSGEFIERAGPIAETYGLQLPARDPELATKTQRFAQVGQELAKAKVTGGEISDDLLQEAIGLFGLEAVREEVSEYNEAAVKRIDQLAREKEISIRGYAAETGRITAGTAAEKAAREPSEEQQKQWLAFVTDIEDHLRQEGVTGGELSDRIRGLFATGKILDPLDPSTRGQAYTYLGEIRAKLIQGQALTSGDIRFLTTVRNTAQILKPPEEGGGLVDPSVSVAETEAMEATIQAHMDVIRELTKDSENPPDEAGLRRLAMEFLRLIK